MVNPPIPDRDNLDPETGDLIEAIDRTHRQAPLLTLIAIRSLTNTGVLSLEELPLFLAYFESTLYGKLLDETPVTDSYLRDAAQEALQCLRSAS